jgi:hypothetical protein
MASGGMFNNVSVSVYSIWWCGNLLIDKEGAIMLMHELNNFTMSEAVKFYPKLKAAFKVGGV